VKSAIYRGDVRHRRLRPRRHAFRFRLFMMYLDLDELPTLFAGRLFWSSSRPALAWFRRADYLGPANVPLDDAVRNLVDARLGFRPAGPIRLLTHLRYLGFIMNPVSFYYCFDAAGERVEAIVAEITNTPWGERHSYVLDGRTETAGAEGTPHRFAKTFHVSPFMPMNQGYVWRFGPPAQRLGIRMESTDEDGRIFEASMMLERQELTGRSLAGVLLRYPFMTAVVGLGIYWHALRLMLKRVPFHVHPSTETAP
jgi:DUF1365 family protein